MNRPASTRPTGPLRAAWPFFNPFIVGATMAQNTATILGIAAALFGVLLFLTSVTGVFWPSTPTPVTDPGMLWTSVIFVLLGLVGFALGRQQAAQAA